MAKIEMKGLNEYTRALSRLEAGLKEQVIGPAIYDAAEIVADEIRAGIDALPVDGGYGTPQNPLEGPNQIQKDALQESFGITRMGEKDGFYNVKIGFDGYNEIRTKRWPRGQPNAMVARSIERGTSFMLKTPFIKRAMSKARKRALESMQRTVDRQIKKLMK